MAPARPDLSVLQADDEYEYRPRRGRWFKLGLLVLLVAAGIILTNLLPPDQYVPFLMPEVETITVQRLTPAQASTA